AQALLEPGEHRPELPFDPAADVTEAALHLVAQGLSLIEDDLTSACKHILQCRQSPARLLLHPWHPHPLPQSRNKTRRCCRPWPWRTRDYTASRSGKSNRTAMFRCRAPAASASRSARRALVGDTTPRKRRKQLSTPRTRAPEPDRRTRLRRRATRKACVARR